MLLNTAEASGDLVIQPSGIAVNAPVPVWSDDHRQAMETMTMTMAQRPYQIGELAEQAGVSQPTVRYYEEVGIMPPPRRAENGYRLYDGADVDRLRFISRARNLDFSLEEIGEILELRERGKAPCAYVLGRIGKKVAEIEQRMEDLARLRTELRALKQAAESPPPQATEARSRICDILQKR